MENVNKQLLDLISSVLACEIEAGVFEQYVVPALNVARKVVAEQAQQAAGYLPAEMTPAMMRSVQMRSELGAYAAANLSGAYDLFADFWRVAVEEAQKGNP